MIVEERAVHEVGAVEHSSGQLAQVGDHKEPDPGEECPRAARDCLPGPPHRLQFFDREVAEEAEEEGDHEQLAESDDALEGEELQQVGHFEIQVKATKLVKVPALARLCRLVRQVIQEEDGRTDDQARMQEDIY